MLLEQKIDMAYSVTKVYAQNPNARYEDLPRLFVNLLVMLNDVDSTSKDSSDDKWLKLQENYAKPIPKIPKP